MSDPTQQTILTALMEIKESQGEIQADVKHAIKQGEDTQKMMQLHVSKDDATHASLDRRVGSLEETHRRVKWIAGGVSTLVAAIAWAFDHLRG